MRTTLRGGMCQEGMGNEGLVSGQLQIDANYRRRTWCGTPTPGAAADSP